MAVSEKELEEQLTEAGKRLLSPPSSVDELLPLLDGLQRCLERVEQSPSESTLDALSPSINALVANKLLGHLDPDVNVSVATCISEITRITAPDAPYDDNQMKEIFKLIVSSFEKLYDKSNRSYNKRASILETVAKVRSCLLMLDLECDTLIIEMFQHFLKAVRDNHHEDIFQSMEAIMTLVLDESEDISPELLSSILFYLKKNNEDVQPMAQKLAEKVLVKCAKKVKPYLLQAFKLLRISLNDYKEVVANVCQASGALELNNLSNQEAHDTLEDSDGTKIPSNSDKKVDVQHISSKTSRIKTMNVPSASPSGQQHEKCHSNKVGQRKKKESTIHQSTPEHVASKKEDESISGLDTKSTKQFHRKDESVGSEQGDKRRGKGKSIVRKDLTKASSEDKAKECGTPPKSAARSVKNKSLAMSSKKKHTASGEKASRTEENGENFVGSKIKVWWPDDQMFYEGLVDSFDHAKKKHKIIYADGDVEVLNLKKEKWELITGDADSVKGNANDDGNGDASSEIRMKKAKTNSDSLNNEEKSEQLVQKGVGGTASKRRHKNRGETNVDKKSEDGSSKKTGLVDEDGGKTPVDFQTPLGSTKKRKQETSNISAKSKKSNSNGSVVKGKGKRTKKGKKASGETGMGTSGTKSGRKRQRAS